MAIDHPAGLDLINTEAVHRSGAYTHTHTHTTLYIYVGVLSTIFNSDLYKEQEAPRGCDGYARQRERKCVCVCVCKHTFVCLPDNATSRD